MVRCERAGVSDAAAQRQVSALHTLVRRSIPVLLVIGLPFFFVGGPGFYSARSSVHLWDLGHILYFGLFTLWLTGLASDWQTALSRGRRLALLVLLPFVAGLIIECLQFAVNGRRPGMDDLFRNTLGILLVLVFQCWPLQESRQRLCLGVLRAASLVLLCCALWPLFRSVRDEDRAWREFPVLADFESKGELSRWYHANQLRQEKSIVRHGSCSARVQLSTARISGVTLLHFPHDWHGYRWLRFSVYNPLNGPLELNCRLDDSRHRRTHGPYSDRFNTQLVLRPGWNDLAIDLEEAEKAPKGRRMDMSHIAGFSLFVVQQKAPLALFLDHVRLN